MEAHIKGLITIFVTAHEPPSGEPAAHAGSPGTESLRDKCVYIYMYVFIYLAFVSVYALLVIVDTHIYI